jgi:hypothetical protein
LILTAAAAAAAVAGAGAARGVPTVLLWRTVVRFTVQKRTCVAGGDPVAAVAAVAAVVQEQEQEQEQEEIQMDKPG